MTLHVNITMSWALIRLETVWIRAGALVQPSFPPIYASLWVVRPREASRNPVDVAKTWRQQGLLPSPHGVRNGGRSAPRSGSDRSEETSGVYRRRGLARGASRNRGGRSVAYDPIDFPSPATAAAVDATLSLTIACVGIRWTHRTALTGGTLRLGPPMTPLSIPGAQGGAECSISSRVSGRAEGPSAAAAVG